MAKTSAELNQDISAINGNDRDSTVTRELVKNIGLVSANIAAGLETINAFEGGPSVSPTAASLYSQIDVISTGDRDTVIMQELLKGIALTIAKIAREVEAIRAGMGPQSFTKSLSASIGVTSEMS